MQKRVLIADTHPSMLEGVRVLLEDMFDVMFMVVNWKDANMHATKESKG